MAGVTVKSRTAAGDALVPTMDALAVWGKSWLPATLSTIRRDPNLVMWDMHRRLNLEQLPVHRTTLLFSFPDQPKTKQDRWIICDQAGARFCTIDPGFEVDLYVTTDARTLTLLWYGDVSLKSAVDDGSVAIDGPPERCAAFPSWIKSARIADVPRHHPYAV